MVLFEASYSGILFRWFGFLLQVMKIRSSQSSQVSSFSSWDGRIVLKSDEPDEKMVPLRREESKTADLFFV